MNEYMKRYQIRVYNDDTARNGEFVNEYNSLEEARKKKKEYEDHRKAILEGEEPDWVKNHYRDLRWVILDLTRDKIYE